MTTTRFGASKNSTPESRSTGRGFSKGREHPRPSHGHPSKPEGNVRTTVGLRRHSNPRRRRLGLSSCRRTRRHHNLLRVASTARFTSPIPRMSSPRLRLPPRSRRPSRSRRQPAEIVEISAPPAALAKLGAEGIQRLRSRYAEILVRITERTADPERREELKWQADRLNPDSWVTAEDVAQALEQYETVLASLGDVIGQRRRRKRRGGRQRPAESDGSGREMAGTGESVTGPQAAAESAAVEQRPPRSRQASPGTPWSRRPTLVIMMETPVTTSRSAGES